MTPHTPILHVSNTSVQNENDAMTVGNFQTRRRIERDLSGLLLRVLFQHQHLLENKFLGMR
jgi:hypothetical protein